MASYDDSDSSSDEGNVLDDYKGKNGLMFLIDFREDMFNLDPNSRKTYFNLCLESCKTIMKEVARSGKDDLVGISLIGTEKGVDSQPSPIANIHPLSSVSAAIIKEIDEIMVDNGESIGDKYGKTDKSSYLNLIKIFTSCLRMFLDCKSKIYAKTFVILTNDSEPFGQNKQLAHLARKRAKKLSDAAIDLIVVGLGNNFDSNKFYNELIALARGELSRDWAKIDRVKKLRDIDNHIFSLLSRLSRTNRDLLIGDGVAIPISLYKLFKEPKVKFKRKVIARQEDTFNKDDDEPSSQNSTALNEPSSQTNAESSVSVIENPVDRKSMVPLVGGKLINITRAELYDSGFEIEVGLTIIGFMATEDIPEYLSVKPPRVMMPNYFSTDGLKAFTCLLEYCREEKLSMICWYRYNRFGDITLVVGHPMSEQSDVKGNVCPSGFCISTLPYADNYSDPEYKVMETAEPSDKQMDAARNIVRKLTVGYSVDTFQDFELQRTLAMVEALALDYDDIETVTDNTILDDSSSDSRIANFISDFNDCSHLGAFDSLAAVKRAGSSTSRSSKNPRLSSIEGIIEFIKEGKSELLTVADLKQALDSLGVSYAASSKKAQLVQLANAKFK